MKQFFNKQRGYSEFSGKEHIRLWTKVSSSEKCARIQKGITGRKGKEWDIAPLESSESEAHVVDKGLLIVKTTHFEKY